ncbi:hypothetical protein H4R33_006500 [Dimargaris cristalligena]|uniref:Uncharacterized protein n=1 Tax=Dimargaris cristalligena TaxID=215637 RepID=A0A4P9ZWU8_9FUNG|nr:hypothetical protein H4R33_006500 [Dimargaris cristalligena]RKP37170.1 hypothetical protein BJ085DRAFT_37881 [Dimargaris cristalligena]|eukprot:RKP37170.1 hypothetical protein BJ085DRAFT_37881 [Dimargaris cristalligena]
MATVYMSHRPLITTSEDLEQTYSQGSVNDITFQRQYEELGQSVVSLMREHHNHQEMIITLRQMIENRAEKIRNKTLLLRDMKKQAGYLNRLYSSPYVVKATVPGYREFFMEIIRR